MVDEVQKIAEVARRHGLHVAVAESLTSGALASRLGAGPEAVDWFRGGIVAYSETVKFHLLGVTPGPVVTDRCAQEMAAGAARLLDAEIAIGITGVGGPGPSDGKPAGTVIMGVVARGTPSCHSFHFDGDPEDILAATVNRAVSILADALGSAFAEPPGS